MQTVKEDAVSDAAPPADAAHDVQPGHRAARALTRSASAPPRAAADARRASFLPVPDLEDAGLVLDRATLFRPRGLAVSPPGFPATGIAGPSAEATPVLSCVVRRSPVLAHRVEVQDSGAA